VGGLGSRYVAAADQRGGANVEPFRDALVGPNDRVLPIFGGRSKQVCADLTPS
jgi:hypothetical protein